MPQIFTPNSNNQYKFYHFMYSPWVICRLFYTRHHTWGFRSLVFMIVLYPTTHHSRENGNPRRQVACMWKKWIPRPAGNDEMVFDLGLCDKCYRATDELFQSII